MDGGRREGGRKGEVEVGPPPPPAGADDAGQETTERASVVCATTGRPDRLPALVDAVLSDPAAGELIVVVDGPDAETERVLRQLAADRARLRSLAVSHRGQLGALDQGVATARYDVVVLLDDDVLPATGTIGGHLAHHRREAGLVVLGSMPVGWTDGVAPSVATRLYADAYLGHVALVERGEVDVLDVVWTGNLSMRTADCRRVGLASPRFTAHFHADRDLGYRLAAAGLTGRFDPALAAVHVHRRTDAEFLRDATRQGAGWVALHRAHGAQLGAFSLRQSVRHLPLPLRWFITTAGSSPLARTVARALMAAAHAAAGRLPRVELAAAKTARRIMQWHGARRALSQPSSGPSSGRTLPPTGR